ncbi:LysE/ArgO family amino acid transporter [Aquincola tertiaricarbonis]|uniref:LysE/ArgO family amino acid transporter n=1 Tax=Aquincola tertiaricarbonis TaxID=391953 RepID=A0ABY4SDY0_AQUTE|nr:LysE/ArgO family amino acid transporter [Aquincola tertiaricarbonis]URI10337.1 LysE/ArgO family amino acid transporter [Aquincola tertiaricarbonis]
MLASPTTWLPGAPPLTVFLNGFVLMAGLIVAIGAQNALILRQGLMRRHVGPVVAFCAASDVLLVMAGVFGVGTALTRLPLLMEALRWGGALFLAWCGWRAARRAWRPGSQGLTAATSAQGLAATLGTTAALTFLNPHVYLDTLVLVGTVAAQQPSAARPLFAAGAGSASVLWFLLLGYGAAALAPWLARPATWRVVDGCVALVMFGVAASLIRGQL